MGPSGAKGERGREIGEGCFDIVFLVFTYMMAFVFFWNATGLFLILFAFATIILALGETIHLVPRIIRAFSGDSEDTRYYIGLGSLVSSITMPLYFYIMLAARIEVGEYMTHSWRLFFYITGGVLLLWSFTLIALPQNKWFKGGSVRWTLIRGLPFLILGLITALLYMAYDFERGSWGRMASIGFLIVLSYAFYIPVAALWKKHRAVGMLMIPKTACYMAIMIVVLNLIYTGRYMRF